MGYGCAEVSECGVCCDPTIPGGFAAPSPGGQAALRATQFLISHIGAANLHCQLCGFGIPYTHSSGSIFEGVSREL